RSILAPCVMPRRFSSPASASRARSEGARASVVQVVAHDQTRVFFRDTLLGARRPEAVEHAVAPVRVTSRHTLVAGHASNPERLLGLPDVLGLVQMDVLRIGFFTRSGLGRGRARHRHYACDKY